MTKNKLLLIGAGPGDPELMTLKAMNALNQADIILYDALVNLKIFDLIAINPDNLIFVGKRKNLSEGKQEEINNLILKFLREGKTVARLKGGDPLIFARGMEEYKIAIENNYEVEIIPGLSSGLALASLNAITLTLRNHSDSLLIETAHDFNSNSTKAKYWLEHIERGATLILYMGLGNIVEICNFFSTNYSPTLSIIAIENGSLENQRIIESNASELAQELIDQSFTSPVIFYIGINIAKRPMNIHRHFARNDVLPSS